MHALAAAILALATVPVIQAKGFRLSHLRVVRSYPPTWLAVPTAIVLAGVINPIVGNGEFFFGFHVSSWVNVLVTAAAVLVVVEIANKMRDDRPLEHLGGRKNAQLLTMATDGRGQGADAITTDDLLSWISQPEEPINSVRDDKFNYHRIAHRCLEKVNQRPFRSLALLGAFGSGKSSVRNLMLAELHDENPNIIPVIVDGWGLNDKTVLEYLLEGCVSALSEKVDCLSLAGLPEHYRAAMGESGSWFGKFAFGLSGGVIHPIEVLKQLNLVLLATGYSLLVIVEDIDRNRENHGTLPVLASLLDRLRHLSEVTFLLSINSDDACAVDFARLCDEVEVLPLLSTELVWSEVKKVSEGCIKSYPADVEPGGSPHSHFQVHESLLETPFGAPPRIFADVVQLLSTPRALRTAMRHVYFSWQRLHGEVVFEELLLLTTIKASAPGAFAFIVAMPRRFGICQSRTCSSMRTRPQVKSGRRYAASNCWLSWPSPDDTPRVSYRH